MPISPCKIQASYNYKYITWSNLYFFYPFYGNLYFRSQYFLDHPRVEAKQNYIPEYAIINLKHEFSSLKLSPKLVIIAPSRVQKQHHKISPAAEPSTKR